MKPNLYVALGIAGLLVGCAGSDPSSNRVINIPAKGASPATTRANDGAPSGAPQISGIAQVNQAIKSGFDETTQQQNEAKQKAADQQAQKDKKEAEEKALARAHEAMMEDKRNAAAEKQSIMELFGDAMAVSAMLKMMNPDPCANQSFIDGLSGLGKSLGEGLSATQKGLNDSQVKETPPVTSLPANVSTSVSPPVVLIPASSPSGSDSTGSLTSGPVEPSVSGPPLTPAASGQDNVSLIGPLPPTILPGIYPNDYGAPTVLKAKAD